MGRYRHDGQLSVYDKYIPCGYVVFGGKDTLCFVDSIELAYHICGILRADDDRKEHKEWGLSIGEFINIVYLVPGYLDIEAAKKQINLKTCTWDNFIHGDFDLHKAEILRVKDVISKSPKFPVRINEDFFYCGEDYDENGE